VPKKHSLIKRLRKTFGQSGLRQQWHVIDRQIRSVPPIPDKVSPAMVLEGGVHVDFGDDGGLDLPVGQRLRVVELSGPGRWQGLWPRVRDASRACRRRGASSRASSCCCVVVSGPVRPV
jgi:hypothetical protein